LAAAGRRVIIDGSIAPRRRERSDSRRDDREARTLVEILIPEAEILARVAELGRSIEADYRGKPLTIVAVLTGSLIFLADLVRKGRDVLLLDDILDTGQTLSVLVERMTDRGALSVKTAVLLRKIGRQVIALEPDYCGFTIPDKFVVGYGLDYDDDYRHLPFVGVLGAES
jgi:hypoxanthine phosphoribosyltransferase